MIFTAIALSLSIIPAQAPQATPAIKQDLNWEYVYASGDTRRIKAAPVQTRTFKPKFTKRLVTFIPQDNGLDKIIARVKRENNIKEKGKS